MKRNAKTIIAGMIALAISHTAMADDIKVAVVGAMSGPIAQWGDMEFNGARQAIKDINAKGDTIYQFAPIRTSPQNPLNIKHSVDSQFVMVRFRSLTAALHDG